MKIRPIASLVGILLVTACAKGENAHPIDNVQLGLPVSPSTDSA